MQRAGNFLKFSERTIGPEYYLRSGSGIGPILGEVVTSLQLATLPASSSIARGLHDFALVEMNFLGWICIYLDKIIPILINSKLVL